MIAHSVRMTALLAALLAVPGLQAAEVAGVRVADSIKVGNSELVLNGAGLRTKVFVKVYIGSLYVTQKANTPAALLDANAPRRMTMRLMRDVDSDALYGALADGLKANNSEAELAALQARRRLGEAGLRWYAQALSLPELLQLLTGLDSLRREAALQALECWLTPERKTQLRRALGLPPVPGLVSV